MTDFSTTGILLRRVDFGDYDLIVTFLTRREGKLSVIAKAAKKSTKRFGGILELFAVLNIVCKVNPLKKGLPVLQEAALGEPFMRIRGDIHKTAHASYWAELVHEGACEGEPNSPLFDLLRFALKALEQDTLDLDVLGILFQMRFMALCGLGPNLAQCSACQKGLAQMEQAAIGFDLKRGGLLCPQCRRRLGGKLTLSKGTIKELQWIENGDMAKAQRMRFTQKGLKESRDLLEAFVPYHLGRELRSLKFLRQLRG